MTPLQSKIYEVFLIFKDICVKHDLRYWAYGGTCLGAVRHKGFIPWDDDLDVGMPDVDYYKFLEVAPKELMQTKFRLYAKPAGSLNSMLYDTTTTYIRDFEILHPERYKGVYIEIQPFTGLPENIFYRKIHMFTARVLAVLNLKRAQTLRDTRHVSAKILWVVLKPINLIVPIDFYRNLWNRLVRRYPFDKSKYSGFLWAQDKKWYDNFLLEAKWFNNTVEILFEDTMIRCPGYWNDYLTKHFGDYMSPPPKEEQDGAHSQGGIIDLDRSYEYYQQNGVDVK